MNLESKIVLITGASSGIGKACSKAFANEKSYLAITGRNLEALEETKKICCSLGLEEKNVLLCQGDMTKDSDCEKIVNDVINYYGKLHILVNCAGCITLGTMENVTMEQFDNQMRVNTRSPFLMSKLCLPHILSTKGNIVNVSSVNGLRAFAGVIAYNMSKAAMDQMTRSLALEVASRGVRVNSVNPGVVITEVHKRGGMSEEAYQKFLEHSKTTHAMGRVGEPHEVADTVVFLASDKASFITGATLQIDGGRSIMCPR